MLHKVLKRRNMKNNIEYIFEDLIIIRKFYGDVTIEELKSSLEFMIENNFFTKKKGIISDFSKANFLVNQEDLLLLKDLFIKHYTILGKIRFAQIIDTPKIAQTMLFEKNNSDVRTRSFSTGQAARTWIIFNS